MSSEDATSWGADTSAASSHLLDGGTCFISPCLTLEVLEVLCAGEWELEGPKSFTSALLVPVYKYIKVDYVSGPFLMWTLGSCPITATCPSCTGEPSNPSVTLIILSVPLFSNQTKLSFLDTFRVENVCEFSTSNFLKISAISLPFLYCRQQNTEDSSKLHVPMGSDCWCPSSSLDVLYMELLLTYKQVRFLLLSTFFACHPTEFWPAFQFIRTILNLNSGSMTAVTLHSSMCTAIYACVQSYNI